MKNLKKLVSVIVLALVMLSGSNAFGQGTSQVDVTSNFNKQVGHNKLLVQIDDDKNFNDNNVKFCYTTSCCSFWFFTVEVWSETTCFHASVSNKNSSDNPILTTKFNFKNKIHPQHITIKENVVIAGLKDRLGNLFVLPKGKYKLNENNSITYTPILLKSNTINNSKAVSQKICIDKVVDGNLFGNHYHYEVHWCISWSVSAKIQENSGNIIMPGYIDLKLDRNQLEKVKNGDNIFTLKSDLTTTVNGKKCILKAGEYQIANDGKIYFYTKL